MTTHPLLKTFLVTAGLLVWATLGHAQPSHKAKPPKPAPARPALASPQDWQPNASLLGQLDQETDLLGYHIRAPKGYALEQKAFQNESDTGTTYTWKGAWRTDQTRPTFIIYVRNIVPGFHPKSAENALNVFQQSTGGKMRDFVQSPTQEGTINGLSCVRAYWKGTNPKSGHHLHGFTYVTVEDHAIITISCVDNEPYQTQTLAVAEAATETLRRA